jgi:hypothetical protein
LEFPGNRKDASDLRQPGMKSGVETRSLWQSGEMLSCEADDRQSRRNMQRREGGSGF